MTDTRTISQFYSLRSRELAEQLTASASAPNLTGEAFIGELRAALTDRTVYGTTVRPILDITEVADLDTKVAVMMYAVEMVYATSGWRYHIECRRDRWGLHSDEWRGHAVFTHAATAPEPQRTAADPAALLEMLRQDWRDYEHRAEPYMERVRQAWER